MKKTLAWILAMVLLFCGITAMAETATEVITLYLTGMSMDGGETYIDTAAMGMNMTVVLYDNNIAKVITAFGGEEQASEGTWSEAEDSVTIDIDGAPLTLKLAEDGNLYGDADGSGFRFSLTEPETIALPAAIEAGDIAAFDGTWNMAYLSMMGITLDMDTLLADETAAAMFGLSDSNSQIVIDNGNVAVFGDAALTFEFADGKLQYIFPDEEMSSLNQTISLAEDGSLVYELIGAQLFFTKAE